MERFKRDRSRLLEIIKSIEKIQAAIATIKFENFIKGEGAREAVASQLRGVGNEAKQLSEEFKLSNRNIDWNYLHELQFVIHKANDQDTDPYNLWYLVENDLPIIKDKLYEITAVLEDKEDDAFYI
jgi:uncharacterized protein with HEPN domain